MLTVDTAAPSVPVIDPVNGTDPITGTAEPGSTVTVTYPDGTKQSWQAQMEHGRCKPGQSGGW